MDKEFIRTQKEKLEFEHARIEKDLSSVGVETGAGYKPKTTDVGDSADDTALEMESYETNLGIETPLLELKTKIETALKRIEDGTYGTCTEGGSEHEIEKDRLLATPSAATCIKHAR